MNKQILKQEEGYYMISANIIRENLKNIRYYYSRQSLFDNASTSVGQNEILKTIEKYNVAVCKAPPRLYDLYVSLYLQNNTQESLSEKMGYSIEHISRMNSQLIKFLQKQLDKEVVA